MRLRKCITGFVSENPLGVNVLKRTCWYENIYREFRSIAQEFRRISICNYFFIAFHINTGGISLRYLTMVVRISKQTTLSYIFHLKNLQV